MKRKLAHNNSQGNQIDNFRSNLNVSHSRTNYSYKGIIDNHFQQPTKMEENKNLQSVYSNDLYKNNKINKSSHSMKNISSSTSHPRMTNGFQNRQSDLKKERSENDLFHKDRKNKNKNGFSELSISKEDLLSSSLQIENNRNLELKKSHSDINKNALSIEEGISAGIRSQLIYSFMGKSEFSSLTKSIITLLNIKKNGDTDEIKTEKSQCMLYLDHLILRTRKLSKILEIIASEELESSELNRRLSAKTKLKIENLNSLINDKVTQASNTQLLWNKCETLCESVNFNRNKIDIQNQVNDETIKLNELQIEISKRKTSLSEKIRHIHTICGILSGLVSQ